MGQQIELQRAAINQVSGSPKATATLQPREKGGIITEPVAANTAYFEACFCATVLRSCLLCVKLVTCALRNMHTGTATYLGIGNELFQL